MPNIIVIDPAGVTRGGQKLPPGEHEVPSGPHLDAWLRFGQAELVPAPAPEPAPAKKK
jgi:hypothetical protein